MRALIGLGIFVFTGSCGGYFGVRGTVTRCSDGEPLVGVRATLSLDDGVSSGESGAAYSAPDGSYWVEINEPPTASATLTLDKPGYVTIVESFSEAPEVEVDYCLELAPPS